MEYLKNLAINEFGNPKIRKFTLNVVQDLVRENNELIFKVLNKDFHTLNLSDEMIYNFLYNCNFSKDFLNKSKWKIHLTPNIRYFFNYLY